MKEDRFLNFPVVLLQSAFDDVRAAMANIKNYAGFVHTLKLEHGDEDDRMTTAGRFFGIKYGPESYNDGEELYNSLPANLPMTGIGAQMCLNFYSEHKTEDEIAVLLGFLALKSIIGLKPYIKCTNQYLIARMGGYSSVNDLPDPLPDPLRKYATRRRLDAIKFELQTNWNLNFYSHRTRGFYTSFNSKFDLNRLVFEAEKRRKQTKEKSLAREKAEARAIALKKLNTVNY